MENVNLNTAKNYKVEASILIGKLQEVFWLAHLDGLTTMEDYEELIDETQETEHLFFDIVNSNVNKENF